MTDDELVAIYNEAIDSEGMTVLDGLRAVAKAEREACASVAENFPTLYGFNSCFSVAAEIRKRSNV